MDLDELKAAWERQNAMLAGTITLNAGLMRQSLVAEREARIRAAGAMSGFGFYVWIGLLIAFGLFIAAHIHEAKFLAPAVALHAWTIAMGVVTLRQREALRALDFSCPPAEAQRDLAKLRMARAGTVKWGFLTGQIVWWIPFAIVVFKGLFDIDLYTVSRAMPSIMLWNVAGGIAFVPVALALGALARPLFAGSQMSNAFLDAITGRDVLEARAALDRLARFQSGAG